MDSGASPHMVSKNESLLVQHILPRSIDEMCSDSSGSSGTPNATAARWCGTLATCSCVTTDHPEIETSELRLSAWKSSLVTVQQSGRVFQLLRYKASTKGTQMFGCRPGARKRTKLERRLQLCFFLFHDFLKYLGSRVLDTHNSDLKLHNLAHGVRFLLGGCFCTKTRLPSCFSENGEKWCFF